MKENENYTPAVVIILRPTSPLRKIRILKKALNILIREKKIDSVRSISEMRKTIYKSWLLTKNNYLKNIIKNDTLFKEPHNAPRQRLKKFFYQNAVYDLFKTSILKKSCISGTNIYGLKTNENIDIDNIEDIKKLRKYKKSFTKFEKFIEG